MNENTDIPNIMSAETMQHIMEPKNYGKLENANCVGVALDEKTKEYVVFNTLLDGQIIKDVKFATNGCQDTVVVGSMFTEMIKNNDLEYANRAIEKINEKLGDITPEQQACADIVFSAFIASMKNFDNRQNGADEELHVLKMKKSCEATSMEKQSE
jgi:nitrogen fixation NifU-like protein